MSTSSELWCASLCAAVYLLQLGCGSATAHAEGRERSHSERVSPVATRTGDPGIELGPKLPSLDRMTLTFVDPATFESFRAEGPFHLVAWRGDGVVEFVGRDRLTGAPTPMWLETRGEEVWARVEVRGVEFLVRLD